MAVMSIVEPCLVTGGVDTHLDVHVAAVVDVNGGVLGVESFPTTPAGHSRADRLDATVRAGGAGSGSRAPGREGAGLARHLHP